MLVESVLVLVSALMLVLMPVSMSTLVLMLLSIMVLMSMFEFLLVWRLAVNKMMELVPLLSLVLPDLLSIFVSDYLRFC